MIPDLVDRNPQNLPVPLGGMVPVRVTTRRAARVRLPRLPTSLSWCGLASGAIGAGLLLAPSPVSVSLVGDHLQVGGMVLSAAQPSGDMHLLRFHGDASYVLALGPAGRARAAAVWTAGGSESSGVCALHPDGSRLIDECSFTSPAGRLTSVDVLDTTIGPQWQRTYSDGVHVTIPVSPDGGVVPVAFPVGH